MEEQTKYFCVKTKGGAGSFTEGWWRQKLIESARHHDTGGLGKWGSAEVPSTSKDDIFPVLDNAKGETITLVLQMDAGAVSDLLHTVAVYKAEYSDYPSEYSGQ